jgi:dolichol-phosphate mannosyltransferase
MKKILIVIPTYNEKENIPNLLGRLLNVHPELEILVVDDHSPDGTAEIVKSFRHQTPRVHLLERPGKMGIGSAYIAGFQWGMKRSYDAFIEMDADLSHRPRYIPKFLAALSRYDIVIGSRWIQGGGIGHWPLFRILLSRFANLYSQAVLGVSVRDLTGGFTAYHRRVLEAVNLEKIHSDGYSFQIELKYRSLKQGFHWVELPIQFPDRKKGKSKISKHIILEALIIIWVLRFSKVH